MKLPSAEEYLQIVDTKNPGALATLFNHKFILEADGKTYLSKKSRNHVVFKTEHLSKFYAVCFFLHDDDELFRRYHQIEAYVNKKTLSWKVPFRFMDEEYYPVLLMDWTESFSFTEFLDLIIDDPSRISSLQQELVYLSRDLEKNRIGHGNLNMKHIRFTRLDFGLKLIDYDSMFVPEFEGKDSFSVGTSGFQHPMRLASDFSETIDRFSFWIFITALEAFKIDASLWKNASKNGFNKDAQILFTYRDIAFSHQSALFEKLRSYNDAALNFYCDKLIAFCNSASVGRIEPPRLFEEKDIPSIIKHEQQSEQHPNSNNEVLTKQTKSSSGNIGVQKIAVHVPKAIPVAKAVKEEKKKKKIEEDRPIPINREKKKPIAAFVIIAILLLSAVAYLAWNNQAQKNNNLVAAVPKPTSQTELPVQKKEGPKIRETVFTSANITQFLFQLYQSYNKRDLASILSNYADNLTQYYDAGAMSKNKLSDVIKNLFIKPVYYECQPDLTTLHFNSNEDNCQITIGINEIIKADRRSKAESYSSKIEYTVDSSFKILAEKNIE